MLCSGCAVSLDRTLRQFCGGTLHADCEHASNFIQPRQRIDWFGGVGACRPPPKVSGFQIGMELPPPATVEAEAGAAPTVPPPKGLRRGSLPPDLRPTPAAAGTPVGPITPSKVAQRLLEGLVMTPPKTPPPPSATPRNGTAFFPPGDRVRALREGSVTSQPSSPLAPAPGMFPLPDHPIPLFLVYFHVRTASS